MFEKLKQFMQGKKTQSTLAFLMFIEIWAQSKGIDVDSVKEFIGTLFADFESIKILLIGAAMWFRQLGKKKEVK